MTEVRFPEDQQEGTEATLASWLKAPGDVVKAHEPLAEIETDKVMVEVAAPEDGAIIEINIKEGEAVNPGDVLCTFGDSGSATENDDPAQSAEVEETPTTEETTTESDGRLRLSPAVRHRLKKHGISPAAINGTGRNGRITLSDVKDHLARGDSEPAPNPQLPEPDHDTTTLNAGESLTVPHDKMRKRIAAHMVESLLHTAPHVTSVFEVDLTAVMRHRAAHKEEFARRGRPLTLTVYFIAAAVAAIRRVPQVNSKWHEEHLEIFADMNIGIATALGDEGLIVPVLHQANDKSLSRIAADLNDLTSRARDGKLVPEDVRGGTFTISNHGVSGSLVATPIIINQPQSAILGVGKIEKRVRIREVDGDDVMMIRPMVYVSLTIDHRVLDGFQTNTFLAEFCRTLESWSK
ncbi:MAG TPA: 2-oxo acid dehydrogenase subunit E2 [Xanthomonadales bacterium]|nr:2-oxo acid dehydrogenase subunit E2 [Xanthomonadales bacterium]